MKHKQITKAEAKRLFDSGRLVGAAWTADGEQLVAPRVWHSAATRTWGVDSIEKVAPEPPSEALATLHYFERRGVPNYDEAAGAIFRREPFEIGKMTGAFARVGNLSRLGDLQPEERVKLGQAAREFGTALYIVWSYGTPIAWSAKGMDPYVPPVRYSNTTTQHQHLTATALGIRGFSSSKSAREGKGKSPYGPRAGGW